MAKIIECVPNFSEGRRPEVIDAICDEIRNTEGATLLDRTMDAAHNRAVVTFVGDEKAIAEAAFRACRKAAELIDMNAHSGEHPRMGATDVIPFIPVSGASMDDCLAIAKKVALRIGGELNIPVYLYAKAAQKPERRKLPNIRKGEYEAIKKEMGKVEGRTPDFGPNATHLTAGATAVGARDFLIAYNINLESEGVEIVRGIGEDIRSSGGGYKQVQAAGFEVEVDGRKSGQVSMNLLKYRTTNLNTIYTAVSNRAKKAGTEIWHSELIGLAPADAFILSMSRRIKLVDPLPGQIIDGRLLDADGETGAFPSSFLFDFEKGSTDIADRIVEALDNATPDRGRILAERAGSSVRVTITKPEGGDLETACEAIRIAAKKAGTKIAGSRILGVAPREALIYGLAKRLKIRDFRPEQIIEMNLPPTRPETGPADPFDAPRPFVDELSSDSPAPGGGSVASLSGSLGAALLSMVLRLSIGKDGYEEFTIEMNETLAKTEELRETLFESIRKDAEAFNKVGAAYKLPKSTDEEKKARRKAVQKAFRGAAKVPAKVCRLNLDILRLAVRLAEIGNKHAISDVGVSALMALAGVKGAYLNVKINLSSIKKKSFVEENARLIEDTLAEAYVLAAQVEKTVLRRIDE